jgi:Tol biopolymer transport system component
VHEGLFQVSDHGGQAKLLLKPEDNGNAVSPLFTAAGDLIYSIWTEGNSRIVHISEGSRKTLFKTQGRVHSLTYSPSGHLLFEKEPHTSPGIWVVDLDYETLATSGIPFLIEQDGTRPRVSRDGTLVFVSSSGTRGLRRLVWMDRAGNFLGSIGQPQYGMQEPAISPDGSLVAVSSSEGGNDDIWIHDVLRGTKTRLTSHPAFDFEPTRSPKGDEVALASDRNGSSDIIIKAIDGSGRLRTITTLESGSKGVANWSHDGKYILYFVNGLGLDFDIGYSSLDSGKATLFLRTPFHENEPVVSPDGQFLAYTSNETGRYEVYVSSFPENKGRVLVSLNGGMHPKWSRHGTELFYKERDALMTVPVDTRSGFKAGTPQKLFDKEGTGVNLHDDLSPISPMYDVSADGQKFVMLESLEKIMSNLIIVENWAQQFRFENEDIK